MTGIIDCLKDIHSDIKLNVGDCGSKQEFDIYNSFTTAKVETDDSNYAENGKNLLLYITYRIYLKAKYDKKFALLYTLSGYNTVLQSGNLGDINMLRLEFENKSKPDIESYFNNSTILEIILTINETIGDGSQYIMTNLVPKIIQAQCKPDFSEEVTNESFDINCIIKYLNTDFNKLNPDEYNETDFKLLNDCVSSDPSMLIIKNFSKNTQNLFKKQIDTNSGRLFELMNYINKTYKYSNFQVPKEVVENRDGKTFYNGGNGLNLKEVVKKPPTS